VLRVLLAAGAMLIAWSATAVAETPGPGRVRLAIAAAANLKSATEALRQAFEAEHPETTVTITLGASGALFAQIQGGAPFDLFLSADREYPGKLVAAGLAAGAERVYAHGRLVAWLPPGSTLDLRGRGLAALADPAVGRIALANPAVAPFGRATESALRAAGLWEQLRGKLVLGTSVAQAAQFATTGAADVAFLPLSLTLGGELAAGTAVPVPDRLHPPIEQSAVALAAARQPALAQAFLDLLTGQRGRAILSRAGYGLP
jgi:molybdate transport system substrate-binding protein